MSLSDFQIGNALLKKDHSAQQLIEVDDADSIASKQKKMDLMKVIEFEKSDESTVGGNND